MDRRKFFTITSLGLAGLLLSPVSCTVLKPNGLESTLKQYNKLVRYALRLSHKENVLLINKSEYTLDVLSNSKSVQQYPIELGFDPLNDKQMEGDGCTPEGIYAASLKMSSENTKYHKSIRIDYPTPYNQSNFDKKKADGIIPANATIGGLIEIHGTGSGEKGNSQEKGVGNGSNWTLGCMALSNKDMDKLYDYVRLGTPIVIVRYTSVKYK